MKLTKITKKQLEILTLIYKFRFLTRTQIQTLLKHKNSTRINPWLNDLTTKNYLKRIPRSTKLLENTKPSIYYLAKNGRKILLQTNPENYTKTQLQNTYRDQVRSEVYRLRCLLIADCYISLLFSTLRRNICDLTKFTTRADAAYNRNAQLKQLAPDSYFEMREIKTGNIKPYALFLLHERTPKYYLRYSLSHIINYRKETIYDSQANSSHILIICTKERIKKYAEKFLESKLEEEGLSEIAEDFQITVVTFYEFITSII
jgi:hypothetical protein